MSSHPSISPAQIDLLKESFGALAADADGVTLALLDRLFELDPNLRYLFPQDLGEHRVNLISMIGHIVRRLERWERVEPRILNLGLRHVAYGARPQDYRTFEQALRDVLMERMGLDSGSPVLAAWAILFGVVSDTMLRAGEECASLKVAFEPG